MKVKCIIHKIQNESLEHSTFVEEEHPRDKDGKFISKEEYEAIAEENKQMAAVLANRKMKKELNPPPPETPPLGPAVAEASSNIFKGIQTISKEASNIPTEKGTTTYGKYPDMTDKELNDTINRIQLERRYSDLKGDTKYTKSGSEKTREMLQTIGAVAGVAGSVMSVLATILAITGSKKKTN